MEIPWTFFFLIIIIIPTVTLVQEEIQEICYK